MARSFASGMRRRQLAVFRSARAPWVNWRRTPGTLSFRAAPTDSYAARRRSSRGSQDAEALVGVSRTAIGEKPTLVRIGSALPRRAVGDERVDLGGRRIIKKKTQTTVRVLDTQRTCNTN